MSERSRGGLSALAVRRPIGTLMLATTVVVLGLFFLVRLPVDLLPSITYPRIGVNVLAPGVSPEVAVEEITRPLEEALAATEGGDDGLLADARGTGEPEPVLQAGRRCGSGPQ